eukprot:7389035-Prymnesium_polylepis.1
MGETHARAGVEEAAVAHNHPPQSGSRRRENRETTGIRVPLSAEARRCRAVLGAVPRAAGRRRCCWGGVGWVVVGVWWCGVCVSCTLICAVPCAPMLSCRPAALPLVGWTKQSRDPGAIKRDCSRARER